jgi:hypothetical protein
MLTSTAATIELNRRKSAEKQQRLADQTTNAGALIAAIRFYVGELQDSEAGDTRDIDDKAKRLAKDSKLQWRPYRRAARIALGMRFNNAAKTYKLPTNYWHRLINAGVRPENREKFEQLNPQLIIDELISAFAKGNPVLQCVKELLRKPLPAAQGADEAENMDGETRRVEYTRVVNPFRPPDMEADAREEREMQKRDWFYQLGVELD